MQADFPVIAVLSTIFTDRADISGFATGSYVLANVCRYLQEGKKSPPAKTRTCPSCQFSFLSFDLVNRFTNYGNQRNSLILSSHLTPALLRRLWALDYIQSEK